ncbi:hypothetical protein FOZ63_021229 [Perkinsus olseni]|uniref:Hexose transporter 1 n=1 Tax=Perkinsus olseni TaxID=32597 RepID=A0A7J6NG83_PEROL|nr:hypothetical protein FOZ63_021229 [Perkinsus olseni]
MFGSSDLYVIICSCISLLGGVAVGVGLAFTGPTIDTMRNTVIDTAGNRIDIGTDSDLHVLKSGTESSIFGAILLVGAIIGTLVGGPLADAVGRRAPFFIASVISVPSFVVLGCISNVYGLMFVRVVNGSAVGIYWSVVSVYIGEVAPTRLRGVLGGSMSLAMALGIALSYTFGVAALTDAKVPGVTSKVFCNWRLVSFLCTIPSGVQLFTPFAIPESPRWLAMKGRTEEARRVLVRLRGVLPTDPELSKELAALCSTATDTYNLRRVFHSWILCWREALISVMIHVLVQFTGVSVATFFQTSIFLKARLGRPDIMAITVQLVTVAANAVACCFIERSGRRPLLLISCLGMMVSQLVMGAYFYMDRNGTASNLAWLSVVSAYLYQIAYAFGSGPVRFMISSEIFPDQIRSFAASMSALGNTVSGFVCLVTLEYAISGTSIEAVFWFFGCIAAMLFTFVYLMVPETKGKSLDEVRALFVH